MKKRERVARETRVQEPENEAGNYYDYSRKGRRREEEKHQKQKHQDQQEQKQEQEEEGSRLP